MPLFINGRNLRLTRTKHERIIDIFDQMITFSYAYEWQKLQNNAINELLELRDKISSHVEHESLCLFMKPEDKKSSVIGILNKLSDAVKNDRCPKVIDFDVWLNKPKNLSGWCIIEKQEKEFDEITMLVNYVVCRLNQSLPDEMKPFVTIEQVDAMFKKSYEEISDRFTVPIHKELLVSMIHQHFLKTFAIEQNTFEEVDAYMELVDSYCKKAIQRFVKMVHEKLIDNAVIIFFTQAKRIDLKIDRYYTWALICYGPMNYQDLLSWYSSVNASELIKDGSYRNRDNACVDSENLERFYQHQFDYIQLPLASEGGTKWYMVDSNRTPILVDGKALQNHLVMAIPYDKPPSDLQDKLRVYARYIGNMVKLYGHKYGHTLGHEDELKKSATAYRLLEPPYNRLSLSNVGSVFTSHLLTIMLSVRTVQRIFR